MKDVQYCYQSLTLVLSALSVVISIVSICIAEKVRKNQQKQNRINATIDAFSKLQKEVLDPLIHCTREDISNVVEAHKIGDDSFEDLYNDYRTQIARCEHFAVGINAGTYDFDTFNQLGGSHLKSLYKKLEPLVEESQICHDDNTVPFTEFVELYQRLINQ